MAYPHKWSPISYKSSAGQRKHISQRPMLYRWTTPLTWAKYARLRVPSECLKPTRTVRARYFTVRTYESSHGATRQQRRTGQFRSVQLSSVEGGRHEQVAFQSPAVAHRNDDCCRAAAAFGTTLRGRNRTHRTRTRLLRCAGRAAEPRPRRGSVSRTRHARVSDEVVRSPSAQQCNGDARMRTAVAAVPPPPPPA